MKLRLTAAFLLAFFSLPAALRAQAPAPPPQEQNPAEQPFDPYHAEKSIEIGLYYMKKGNYDAAIERFQDAASRKPNFARPYLLLGEAYEKKGDKASALKSYEKYLEILPRAADAKRVRKRIEKLSREIQKTDARRGSR
jgi:tetratricopeptide (TPR) repeat protein